MSYKGTDDKSQRQQLREQSVSLHGHGHRHPAEELEEVAKYIRDHELKQDAYGQGKYLQDFEEEVASLLGMEAARYMPSGCMAQPIALRIWAERAGVFATAFHPTSHLEIHEEYGYRELHGLKAHLLGDASRPTLARDLDGVPKVSSLLVELPAREIGGQLPTWKELQELTDAARKRTIRLHLDGARLWEAQTYYEKPLPEICSLFDSVYVSFYKGIGALPGAMLLGPRDFLGEAAVWQRRQGGTVYTALANVVSARRRLKSQIERMPLYKQRATELAKLWSGREGVEVIPDPPQVNMFHLRFAASKERIGESRDRAAKKHGIWLMGDPREDGDGHCRVEMSIGDAALQVDDDDVEKAIAELLA